MNKTRIKVLGYMNGQLKVTDGKACKVTTRQVIHNLVQNGKVEVVMPKCICVLKIRNKLKVITHYRVMDEHNRSLVVAKDKLKDLIYNYMIDCVNLTLTSDNRLVIKGLPDDDWNQTTSRNDRSVAVKKGRESTGTNRGASNVIVLTNLADTNSKDSNGSVDENISNSAGSAVLIDVTNDKSENNNETDEWDILNWPTSLNSVASSRGLSTVAGILYAELYDLIGKLSLRV